MSTLPPSELSSKKKGLIMDRSDTPEEEGYRAGSLGAREHTHFLRDSSSIQSMLKNTIETGDVGQFSIKPSQLPVPTQRATPLSSGTTHNRPKSIPRRTYTTQYAGNDADFHQGSEYPYPSSPGSSSAVSFHQTRSPRSYRAPSQGSYQDERSYSMSQSSAINHGLSNPGLHYTNKLQVQGDVRDMRPRSPFAYPTRLKRPGYRPSSPAVSERYKDSQEVSVGGYPEADNASASPMYKYATRKVPSAWQQGFNHSDLLFQRHPSSPASRYSSARSSSTSSPRMPTPGPLVSLDQNTSLSRESLDPLIDRSGWTARQSPSPSPVFYDYTEAFEEENHFRKSVVTLAGESIPENVDIVYQELEGDPSGASMHEMPAYGEVPKALLGGNADGVGVSEPTSAVSRSVSSQIPRRVIGSNHNSAIEATTVDKGPIAPANRHQFRKKTKSFVVESPTSGRKDEAAKVSPKDLNARRCTYAGLSAGRRKSKASLPSPSYSTSSSESTYSVKSSSRPKLPIPDLPTERFSRNDLHSETSRKLPFSPDRPTSGLKSEGQIPLPTLTSPASLDDWSSSEPSQIFAPTPERSLSSPGRRDRFSRIFSIGEGSVDTGEVNENSGRASRYRTAERHIKEEEIWNSGATSTSAFRTENSLTDPPKVALEMRRPVSDSDSQNELEHNQATEEELSKSSNHYPGGERVMITRPEQLTVALKTSELSLSPRIFKIVKPGNSVPGSPSQVSNANLSRTDDISRNPDPGRMALTERDDAKPHLMKRLPSLPNIPSFRSYSPPLHPTRNTLPFSFKPILAGKTDNISVADLQNYDGEASDEEQGDDDKVENQCDPKEYIPRVPHERDSTESLPSSRPWNLDTSYPWTDQQPELQVTMPQPRTDSLQSTNKPPRFKLKVHRASSSVTGLAKLTKHPPSLDISAIRKRDLSTELSQTGAYSCKPRASMTISQSNSSHASQVITQYSENFNSPPASSAVSPSIRLVPPSPVFNLEVRSFFSDDSSQIQPKGSLRKRISQLKSIAARANSTDDATDADRGILGTAVRKSRVSGRTSRQNATTSERMYSLRHLKWRIVEKVRDWFHRGEEKLCYWRGRMTSKGLKDNAPITDTNSKS